MPVQNNIMQALETPENSAIHSIGTTKDFLVDQTTGGKLNDEQLLTEMSQTSSTCSKMTTLNSFEHDWSLENMHLRDVQCLDKDKCGDTACCAEERSSNSCNLQYSISIMCQRNRNLGGIQDSVPDATSNLLLSKPAHKSTSELAVMSVKELNLIVQYLIQSVKGVSSELVSLLLENDALQQESDARNVSIEQLLKLTWKHTESELRTVQMSVILPNSDNETNSN